MTPSLPQAADREALPLVIKGSGFDRETGGFLFLIVNGRSFTAREVHDALAAQAKAGAPQPAGEGDLLLALQAAEWRFTDLAAVIREHGKYDNAGFCDASAKRCHDAIAKAGGSA